MKRDAPLSFNYRALPGLGLAELVADALPRAQRRKRAAGVGILTHVFVEGLRDRGVSYSRRPEWYSAQGRYRGAPLSYRNVVETADAFVAAGLATTWKPRPGSRGWQSVLYATEQLLGHVSSNLANINGPALEYHVGALLKLRDGYMRDLTVPNTDETRLMLRQVEGINEMLAGADVTLEGAPTVAGIATLQTDKGNPHPVYLFQNQVFRGFKHGLDQGGRLYGHAVQQIPRGQRPAKNPDSPLRINGERCVEQDYPSLHPRLLYARLGLDLDGDPYDVPGFDHVDRSIRKIALNTLINAPTEQAAVRAIADQRKPGRPSFADACRLVEAYKVRHPAIAGWFGSGEGTKLQRADSDIAIDVMGELTGEGIPVLPLHDGFIVRERDADALKAAMAEALDRHKKRAAA